MNKQESETLERAVEIVQALNKVLLPLCIMMEHTPIPLRQRAEIGLAFAEAKAALWGLGDALHDGAKVIRAEEVQEPRL